MFSTDLETNKTLLIKSEQSSIILMVITSLCLQFMKLGKLKVSQVPGALRTLSKLDP
jgi:hypothetical protein